MRIDQDTFYAFAEWLSYFLTILAAIMLANMVLK